MLRFQDEKVEGQEDAPEEEEATQSVEEESRLPYGAHEFLELDTFRRRRDSRLESAHGNHQKTEKDEGDHPHYPGEAEVREKALDHDAGSSKSQLSRP